MGHTNDAWAFPDALDANDAAGRYALSRAAGSPFARRRCAMMGRMGRRRSASSITLVLIGSAALYGCGEDTVRHDVYRSRSDCLQDWGNDSSKCEQVRSGPHAGYYYGPSYRGSSSSQADGTGMPRSGSRAVATANVTRGGFGSSASAHSTGS